MLEKVKLTSGHITNEFNNAFLVSIFKSLDTGFTPWKGIIKWASQNLLDIDLAFFLEGVFMSENLRHELVSWICQQYIALICLPIFSMQVF